MVTEPRCTRCGHVESKHGRTGSRPCMAVIGELAKRELCHCDEFHVKAALAA